MFSKAKDKLITVLVHILVWGLLIFVLFMYPPLSGAATPLPNEFWLKQGVHIVLLLFTFYVNSYYLVPRLLLQNRILLFVVCLIVWCFISNLLLAQIDMWLDLPRRLAHVFGKKRWPNLHIDFFGLMTTVFVLGISIGVSLVQHWHRNNKARQDFESLRAATELSFLKAQINPHFFFNTLNTIYALTYVNVETSRESLYKLSHMMRYLLYETQQDNTLLSKEVQFIKDYIGIMKLRLRNNAQVIFNVPDELQEMPIAPMLLLPFVENAFKHGIDDAAASTIFVGITQTITGIKLIVTNSIFIQPEYPENDTQEKGIGLANTRRRLDLLYKDKYTLNINADNASDKYELTMELILV